MIDWIFLPLTLVIYLLAQRLQARFAFPLFNPVLVTLLSLVALLLLSGIPYTQYNHYSHWLTELLQPAVVALGVPLYQQIHAIKRELPQLMLTISVAVMVAVSSTVVLALMLGAGATIAAALAPKSVTTPIAVLIAEQIGGPQALAAIAVIVTGLVGSIIGVPWLRLLKIHSPKAQGVAMGTACHALGTARVAEEGNEHGAYSALSLVLSAIFSALLCPLLVPWLLSY